MKRVRRESPATYLKVCAMLVPKELKVEPSGGVIKAMSDEELDEALAALRQLLADHAAALDGASDTPALPPPDVIDVKPIKPKDD